VRFLCCVQSLEQQETTRKELDALASQFHEECQVMRQAQMGLVETCHTSKMELEAAIDQATNAVISGRTEVAAARQQLSEFVLACKALPEERMHAAVAIVIAEFDRANGGIQELKEEHQTITYNRLPCAKIDISYIFSGVIQARSGKPSAGVQKPKQTKTQGAKPAGPYKWEIQSGGKRRKVSCSYCYASKKCCEGALENGCFACVKKRIKCEPHLTKYKFSDLRRSQMTGGNDGMGVFFAKNRVERPPPLQKFYTKQSRSLVECRQHIRGWRSGCHS